MRKPKSPKVNISKDVERQVIATWLSTGLPYIKIGAHFGLTASHVYSIIDRYMLSRKINTINNGTQRTRPDEIP
jgi:hypothetical protein